MIELTDVGKYGIARDCEAFAIEESDLAGLLPERKPDTNKGSYGKALIFAGCEAIGGAAYLSSHAVLLMGCGMVRILTHEAQRTALTVLLPEALITTYGDGDSVRARDKKIYNNFDDEGLRYSREYRELSNDEIADISAAIEWSDVIVVGCGIGQSERAAEILNLIIENAENRPLVLDADALNLIAAGRVTIPERQAEIIITPHLMEMSRLTGLEVGDIKGNKAGIAEKYAKEHNVTVVLKDAVTVTAVLAGADGSEPNNGNAQNVDYADKAVKYYVNLSGNNGMATAGSGDVLAGMIGGLIASAIYTDTDIKMLTPAAVYIHGLCGDASAARVGRRSLTARNLLEAIPEVLMRVEGCSTR